MRPVKKGPAPASYAPSPMSFSAANAATIAKVLPNPSPTLADQLGVWLQAVKIQGMAHPPPHSQEILDAGKLIAGKIEDIYKVAAVPLADAIGAYCSYCETAISGLLEVEHVAPKAEYPTYSADWDNFLIACSPCNTSKKDHPTREELRILRGSDLTTEAASYTDIRNNYHVWPDREPKSYQLFPFQMVCDPGDKGIWVPVHFLDASDLDNVVTRVSLGSRIVRADLPTIGETNVSVRLLIDPTLNASWPKAATAASTVRLCKLNDLGKLNTTYDRRLINRTRAWFKVLKSLKSIIRLKNPADFSAAWPGFIGTAESLGFFSLWVRILNRYADPAGQNLALRFLADTTTEFPNTDTTRIP